MSTTSKSPRSILVMAHRVARSSLPKYSHVNSPKTFTQHQIFACLALKSAMALDYRGVAALLVDCPELRSAIAMSRAPHWTTLQKAAERLLHWAATAALLNATVAPRPRRRTRRSRRRVAIAAVDSTGFESRHVSRYFVQRKERHSKQVQVVTYGRFPKLALACDSTSHLILSAVPGGGPKPDIDQFRRVLGPALKRARIGHVVADAGYDSEANHEFARDLHGAISHIPAKHGWPTWHPPKGRYRRLMKLNFDAHRYGQRSQVETAMSMIKRRQGQATRGRSFQARCRDLRLMTIAHNVMILRRQCGFLQSQ
jgi:hypothetical protein